MCVCAKFNMFKQNVITPKYVDHIFAPWLYPDSVRICVWKPENKPHVHFLSRNTIYTWLRFERLHTFSYAIKIQSQSKYLLDVILRNIVT